LTTLFTVNQSWYNSAWLYEQLIFASEGDTIIFMEDAVLGLASPISLASFLAKCQAAKISVHAVGEDLAMRGIVNQYASVELLGYDEFVDLVVSTDKQVAW